MLKATSSNKGNILEYSRKVVVRVILHMCRKALWASKRGGHHCIIGDAKDPQRLLGWYLFWKKSW